MGAFAQFMWDGIKMGWDAGAGIVLFLDGALLITGLALEHFKRRGPMFEHIKGKVLLWSVIPATLLLFVIIFAIGPFLKYQQAEKEKTDAEASTAAWRSRAEYSQKRIDKLSDLRAAAASVPVVGVNNNQSGGIIAGTLNLNRPPRIFSPESERELLSVTRGFNRFLIESTMGDSEAQRYAEQIKTALERHGFSVEGVNLVVTMPALPPQVLFQQGGVVHIKIGSRE